MKTRFLLFLSSLFTVAFACNPSSSNEKGAESTQKIESKTKKVLVFSKTAGFRHTSIEAGKEALIKLGEENHFKADTTEDASVFTPDNLRNYQAVIFLNTTGDILNEEQEQAFQSYIQSGGGFVGVHAATDTEYEWPWYNKLVGAYFKNHPKQQNAEIEVVDHEHLSTSFLKEVLENNRWQRFDEWYNFKLINPDVKILATLDETSYEGGENGETHPIAWYHDFDGGKAFYTALGHTNESYEEPLFLQHLLGGIKYAMGEDK